MPQRCFVLFFMLFVLLVDTSFARNAGISNRSQFGCGGDSCHGNNAQTEDGVISIVGSTTVNAGDTVTYTLEVTTAAKGAGFNLSASNGVLDNSTYPGVRLISGEMAHSTAATAVAGSVSWQFDWTAPATAGKTTFFVCVNQVNLDFSRLGDVYKCATHDINVVVNNPGPDPDPDPDPVIPDEAVADAGPDQAVGGGFEVELNATNSHVPEGGSVEWTQKQGPGVALSATNRLRVRFTSPATGFQGGMVFEFRIKDAVGVAVISDRTIINVVDNTVATPWVAPVVVAQEPNSDGVPIVVAPDQQVTLNASVIPLEGDYAYAWRMLVGETVLSDLTVQSPTFVPNTSGLYIFDVEVTDNATGLKATDKVYVNVVNDGSGPTADTPSGDSFTSGESVKLPLTNIADDGSVKEYHWFQTQGPPVTFTNSLSPSPSIVVPPVKVDTQLAFEVLLTDDQGLVHTVAYTFTAKSNGITDFRSNLLSFESARPGYNLALKSDDNSGIADVQPLSGADIITDAGRPEDLSHELVTVKLRVKTGNSATLTTYFASGHEALKQSFIMVDGDDNWVVNKNALFENGGSQVSVNIIDGGAYDRDKSANGLIQIVAGVGVAAAGGSGGGGGLGWYVLLLGGALFTARRRRRARQL